CMVLSLFSSWVDHSWFFFLNWPPGDGYAGPLLRNGKMILFVLLTALLIPFWPRISRRATSLMLLILLASQVLCLGSLWLHTGGFHAFYKDDHPSMMFRLWEFARTYPQMLTYNPYWNAGVVHYAATASGLNGLGLLFWPLWRWAPVVNVYTPVVGFVYIVLIPWLAVFSLRSCRLHWVGALGAGILALGPLQMYFLWFLHYGTVGACFSTFFILPFAALLYRIFVLDERGWKTGLLLAISVWMLLCWNPGFMMAAAVVTIFLFFPRQWTWRKLGFLLACAGLVLVLYLKNLGLLLTHGGDLFRIIFAKGAAGAAASGAEGGGAPFAGPWLAKGWSTGWSILREANPVILFMGVAGWFFARQRRLACWVLPGALLLWVLAGWGPLVKPDMQLMRMGIPMLFLMIVPAAAAMEDVLATADRSRLAAFAGSALVVLLMLTGWNIRCMYAGKSHAPYRVMTEKTLQLAQRLHDLTPETGRVMFLGPTVHYYGDNGHVAMLPVLAGREMMACDYYHFSPKAVEYRYPPKAFRTDEKDLWDFVQDYNVALVVTYHPEGVKYLRQHPDFYEEVKGVPEAALFRVKQPMSLFFKGDGQVDAGFNNLHVTLVSPSDEAVIKYEWHEQLVASAPATLYKVPLAGTNALIGIRPNGAEKVDIHFKSWW
ncbi:MAG: hypothetical protein V2A34_08160, partial [Lentisphaerota bacterium]